MPSSAQVVPVVVLYDYLLNSAGVAMPNETITVVLNYRGATSITPLTTISSGQVSVQTDTNGYWQFSLVPNSNINPANTLYTVLTPLSSYDVTLGAAGPYQSTAAGTLVNSPSSLIPSTSSVGPLTVTGALTVTGDASAATMHDTGLTTGQVVFPVAGGLLSGATGLTWDTTANALTATGVYTKGVPVFDVRAYGVYGTADDTATWNAAITAASAVNGIVFFSGTSIVNGLALSGKSCTIQGIGDGSVLQAKAGITGAVLDLTGYTFPGNFQATREFANFSIIGDNTAGTAKKGLLLPTPTSLSNLNFRNISIKNTGGAPLDCGAAELCNFYSITLNQPVSANANNVPYLLATGAFNGNNFYGLLLRSISAVNAEGVGGVIRIVDDGTFNPTGNNFYGTRFEFPHVPTNGTLIFCGGNLNVFDGTQFYDEVKVSGATGTSYFYMNKPSNIIRGVIPGSIGGATGIDIGVVLNSVGNHVIGLKGASAVSGSNVQVNSTFGFNSAYLAGNGIAANIAAFTDNSGVTTNTLVDATSGTFNIIKGGETINGGLTVAGTGPQVTFTGANPRFIGGTVDTGFNNNANTQVNLNITDVGHLVSGGSSVPTFGTLKTGITSQTLTRGTDKAGIITLVCTGAAPAAFVNVCDVTFGTTYAQLPAVFVQLNGTSTTVIGFGPFNVSTSGFSIVGLNALVNSATYILSYWVIGT